MNIPQLFEQRTRLLMGDALYQTFYNALNEPSPVSIRLNPFKCVHAAVVDNGGRVEWCRDGYYLNSRPEFTFDPLLHGGVYYVQEAASMFIDCVLRQYVDKPVTMLDLCAAPGGKTTAARAALPNGSLLFSNEPVGLRASVLAENVQKFGHPDVVVTNNYAGDYARSGLLFDVVLTDVPCSGEGMFRKDEGAIAAWSVDNVNKCSTLQRQIVEDIWPCIAPGGLLIYSTCTYNAEEDERNVAWITKELGGELLSVEIDDNWHITGSLIQKVAQPVYRFIPGCTKGEGLFMCVIKKTAVGTGKTTKQPALKSTVKLPSGWLKNQDDYVGVAEGDVLRAIPRRWAPAYALASKRLKVLSAGVDVAVVKGKKLIPTQMLALSCALKDDAFPRVEVDFAQCQRYLHRDVLTLSDNAPRGYVVLTYQNVPIGFVNNLGSRANNLFPQQWRVKSTHVPNAFEVVTMKQGAL